MKKNVASQSIGVQMLTAADATAFTGTVTVYVTGDNGTQAIGSVGSGVCTHEGNGYHSYAPAQAETNYDHIAFTFIGTAAAPATVQLYTEFPQTGDSFARIGAPAGASVSADIAAVEAQTDDIGAAGAGLTAVPWNAAWDAEVQSECADALTAYDPPTNTEMLAATAVTDALVTTAVNDLANATDGLGAIKGDTAAILLDTGELQTDDIPTLIAAVQADTNDIQTRLPAALVAGAMDCDVSAIQANAITAASIATDAIGATEIAAGAIDAAALATDAVAEITAAIRALDMGDSVTLQGAINVMYAVLLGTSTGQSTASPVFRNVGDTANRVVATTDANGNRSSITPTPAA